MYLDTFNNRRNVLERRGYGIVNTLINKLPFELHIPSYQFCGPGTKLQKRLEAGHVGKNPLDQACRDHDIAYSKSNDLSERHKADKLLAKQAASRLKTSSSSVGEKLASLGVLAAMKSKLALGLGHRSKCRSRRQRKRRRKIISSGRGISFKTALRLAKKDGSRKNTRKYFKRVKKSTVPRIIPIPRKSGGFLPLLFAGLSALGALTGGASAIASSVNAAKAAQKKLDEKKRHNERMEAIALGKSGEGLYLAPYKRGLGLYLKPYLTNN